MNRTLIACTAILATWTFASAQTDEGPWLPTAEHKKLLSMMPKGVPVGANLKFYKLPSVYQKMFTMNNGTSKYTVITPREEEHPWRVSGGMHHVDRNEWRNVTGLDLPGKIIYWQEDTDVRAFALVPKWRWHFPQGTLAYDVLLRVKDGNEHIFEVRVHEKKEDGWDNGTVYRPDVSIAKAEESSWTWDIPGHDELKGASTTFKTKIDPKTKFVATRRVVIDDGNFTPLNYVGTGMSCNACHARVGQLYDVPGQIYREARRGDDGRFSWHPFSEDGGIDQRWPLERR